MTNYVKVDQGDHSLEEAAVLLLDAVEKSDDHNAGVVGYDSYYGGFTAPEEIVKAAGLKAYSEEEEEVPDRLEGPTPDFFAEHEGETKPEQSVASDNRPIATTDPEASERGTQVSEQAEEEPKKAPAKKATAKKATAKKSTTSK